MALHTSAPAAAPAHLPDAAGVRLGWRSGAPSSPKLRDRETLPLPEPKVMCFSRSCPFSRILRRRASAADSLELGSAILMCQVQPRQGGLHPGPLHTAVDFQLATRCKRVGARSGGWDLKMAPPSQQNSRWNRRINNWRPPLQKLPLLPVSGFTRWQLPPDWGNATLSERHPSKLHLLQAVPSAPVCVAGSCGAVCRPFLIKRQRRLGNPAWCLPLCAPVWRAHKSLAGPEAAA